MGESADVTKQRPPEGKAYDMIVSRRSLCVTQWPTEEIWGTVDSAAIGDLDEDAYISLAGRKDKEYHRGN